MAKYLPGIRVPHRKSTRKKPIARLAPPKTVTIPMAMHIGKPATLIVKPGDLVKVGTKIGEASGYISANVFSSVSGKVVKIADQLMSNGSSVPAVVIESDGEMTVDPALNVPIIRDAKDFVSAIKDGGIVGLGGAGFPTHVKFDVDPKRIEYLIVNCAECEPHVTSDTMTMLNRSEDMAFALHALKCHLGIKNVIVGIENNKKKATAAMQKMASSITDFSVSVKVLPSVYPQGGEKVLIFHTTGRKIPAGKLPIDVGCVVINCTTLATIGSFLKTGMPLVEKCVTVDGGAVKNPQNVIAPVGTAMQELFDFCGGLTEKVSKLVYGGPMMGVTVPNTLYPIMTNTNAILALTKKEARLPKTTACIRCGACINTCPFSLSPASISKAYENKAINELIELSVDSCMECGCCSFICPANRPLVQKNKLSKQLLREHRSKEAH